MQEYLVARVRDAEKKADARKASLRTKADALAYQADMKRKLRRIFGPLPRKTPLNATVVDTLERKHYVVEKVLFESRPNFPVTANLYLPKGYGFPQPGVVAPCGHSHNGKAEPYYQSFCQGLVSKGYVVLIYDPIGQGERLQCFGRDGDPVYGPGTREHIQLGNQQLLVDEFFGTWRVWDGIRALDYLLTRPEVDPQHVGVTGNSGGGTLTTMLVANESRFTMAAPGCYVTTLRCNAENELPADSEQMPPGLLAQGLDTDDMFAVHAPKPLILLTQEKDYFDQRGAIRCFERLKYLYRLLGAEDNVAMMTGPDQHGYARPLREAMYGFFNQACGKTGESGKEPRVNVEPDKAIEVTESGQVRERKPWTVSDATREKTRQQAQARKPLKGKGLQNELRRLLSIPAKRQTPDYRILRPIHKRGHPTNQAANFLVETEPGVLASVLMPADEFHASRPPRKGSRATLYVSHMSADEDLRADALVKKLAGESKVFFAMDTRGIGDSRPNSCGYDTYLSAYGSDYFYSSFGVLFSEPIVGRRTHDVLSVMDFLEESGYTQIQLVGRGWGSLPALFAAVLDARVKKLVLKNAPLSYAEMAETQQQTWPLSSILPRVLTKLDLPDLHRFLGKKLEMVEPWTAKMKPVRSRKAN